MALIYHLLRGCTIMLILSTELSNADIITCENIYQVNSSLETKDTTNWHVYMPKIDNSSISAFEHCESKCCTDPNCDAFMLIPDGNEDYPCSLIFCNGECKYKRELGVDIYLMQRGTSDNTTSNVTFNNDTTEPLEEHKKTNSTENTTPIQVTIIKDIFNTDLMETTETSKILLAATTIKILPFHQETSPEKHKDEYNERTTPFETMLPITTQTNYKEETTLPFHSLSTQPAIKPEETKHPNNHDEPTNRKPPKRKHNSELSINRVLLLSVVGVCVATAGCIVLLLLKSFVKCLKNSQLRMKGYHLVGEHEA
ncbi:uncharacterized protein [Watersipora subatra]|uniref:uncharacterized protein n=1 Tax=Watersipora subatra TaxID=2589382 RepID=UPI00355BC424